MSTPNSPEPVSPRAFSEAAEPSDSPSTVDQVTVRAIHKLEELAGFAEAWDALAMVTPQRKAELSACWVVSYLERCLAPRERWVCLVALAGSRIVGVLPLVISPHRVFGLRRPRLSAPHDLQTASVDFVCARGREDRLIPLMLSALDEAVPGWFELALARLPEESPTLRVAEDWRTRRTVFRDLNGWGSYLPVTGEFAEYEQGLSENFTRNLRKAERKLRRLPHVQVDIVTGPRAGEQDFQTFIDLEASGWKGRTGTAIGSTPVLLDFYRTLTQRLADRGRLEWHFLRAEGKTIAGHLGVRMKRKLTLLKIAYNESYAHCAPGNMLFLELLTRVFADGATDEIDCLTDMSWHQNWRMARRAYHDVRILPRRPVPQMLGVFPRRAGEFLRRVPGMRRAVRTLKKRFRRS